MPRKKGLYIQEWDYDQFPIGLIKGVHIYYPYPKNSVDLMRPRVDGALFIDQITKENTSFPMVGEIFLRFWERGSWGKCIDSIITYWEDGTTTRKHINRCEVVEDGLFVWDKSEILL